MGDSVVGGEPLQSLLHGLRGRKEHALVLDLYAEARPHWETWAGGEFDQTPWLWCMLNNFGGRMGLNGHMDTVASEVARAANTASCMAGIGITPEATFSNPVLFDLFFETIWSETPEQLSPIDRMNGWRTMRAGVTVRRAARRGRRSACCAQRYITLSQPQRRGRAGICGERPPGV